MFSQGHKILVLYHFFQKDETYITNFCHFLEFGYGAENDYMIIVAGDCNIGLPEAPNIRYVFTENKNHDYGGYCAALSQCIKFDNYDYFLFVNSSVRGPFFNHMHQNGRHWASVFIDLLDDSTGLVGSSINILQESSCISSKFLARFGGRTPLSHVQTTAYAMKRKTLFNLIDNDFFNEKNSLTKDDVIVNYELGLSQRILSMDMNIKCLLPEYNLVDYRQPHCDINPNSVEGDVLFKNAYFGRTVHPYEAVFIKSNRDLHKESYLDLLAASAFATKGEKNLLRSHELDAYRARIRRSTNYCID